MEREVDRFGDAAELVELLGDWTTAPGPLYQRLAGALRRAVQAGDLRPGQRLPSERRLATLLAVSRATVVAAYDQLRGLGLADSRRGSGTRISRQPGPRPARADGRVPGGRATSIFQRMVDGPGEVISLAYAVEAGAPELGDALLELVREDLPPLLVDAGYLPRGLPVLREAIATYFTDRGVPTVPDQVVVTTGAAQAIGLAAQLYLRKGATVVVESPSWPGCLDLFRATGVRLVGVPLDQDGIQADGLDRALADEQPALLYVMPTYHNPTGSLMSASRRRQVAGIAARHGVPVLEDHAYAAAARPDADPVPPPIAAHAPASLEVLTVGSLAKAVWAGLRIGWVRAPGEVAERLARLKALADLGSPVLDQALAARLMPRLGALAAARASTLRPRLDHLQALLGEHLPGWRWRTPEGGSALWIDLAGTDARVFAQVALRHGVEVVPGAAMDPSGADDAYDTYIRLPFSFPDAVLTELVRRLSRAWTELQRHGPATTASLRPVV
jgi:DNA-binding transcriptional MocR family regulator